MSQHPLCDALEQSRKGLEQSRTAAYGDALRLAKRLERELNELKDGLKPKVVPCPGCGVDTNKWSAAHHARGCTHLPH